VILGKGKRQRGVFHRGKTDVVRKGGRSRWRICGERMHRGGVSSKKAWPMGRTGGGGRVSFLKGGKGMKHQQGKASFCCKNEEKSMKKDEEKRPGDRAYPKLKKRTRVM